MFSNKKNAYLKYIFGRLFIWTYGQKFNRGFHNLVIPEWELLKLYPSFSDYIDKKMLMRF